MTSKKKLLIVTSRFPFPLEKGDKLRAYYQIKELSQHFNIELISLTEHPIAPKDLQAVEQFCEAVHIFQISALEKWLGAALQVLTKKPFQVGYFHHLRIHRKIQRKLHEIAPDHIYCQLIRAAEYVKNYHKCPKTLDYMDALSKGIERRAQKARGITRWLFRSEFKRLMRYENAIFEYFEHHTIISEQDRAFIFHKNRATITVVPNGVDTSYFSKSAKQPVFDLVFTGNMSYPPNITASKYIVNKVLPHLARETTILIAGANPRREVMALSASNVKITGWVDDIRDSYGAARIFVAPMFIGTGLQNKLLEAMAMGIPCITTTLANNALQAKPNVEILIADDVTTFVEKIQLLSNDDNLYHCISKNSRDFVKNNYDWKPITAKLIDLMVSHT
ncbi:MAG: glycosyltransferase [Bacteroidota bacterium]